MIAASLDIGRDGAMVVPGVVGPGELPGLIAAGDAIMAEEGRPRAGVRAAVQRAPVFAAIAQDDRVVGLAAEVLQSRPFLVRSIFFDKTPGANWDVVWHQDTTIAVEERWEVDGFGPWSVKAGVPHVQPPRQVLDRMVTVRLHLDPCGLENGALLVVPGSHRLPILPDDAIDGEDCGARAVACVASAGDAVVMRPLVLHASKKAATPTHRRVLHLEFAAAELPPPLRWARL